MKLSAAEWAEALALLDEALDQPPAERTRWHEALRCEPAVKDRLGKLLDARRALETDAFLERPIDLGPARDAGLRPGATIGGYRLLRHLGDGGMSTVWLAERDDAQLRRHVALKLPHAGPGQEALAERLLRERDILAALEHPHIARLYDVGFGPQNTPFLVLEHVDGEPIDAWCNRHRCTIRQRLELFRQVLAAVQYAHRRLVLHRDLKPSNILVDATGQAKLLDFGIAKLLGEAESSLTRQGGRALTPDYAAPEQIAGSALDTGCDLYALGVVLFELLAGDRPYRLRRGTPAEMEAAILAGAVRAPSEACAAGHAENVGGTAAALRHQLRGDLDAIVLKALEVRPASRYASADAFDQDLARHLVHEPVVARAPSRLYRLGRFAQRNALAVGAASAVVAALAVGLGMARWQASVARAETAKAQAIKTFLVDLFKSNSIDQVDAERVRSQSVQQLLERSAVALEGGMAGEPDLRAELQGVVGRLLDDLALSEPAERLRRRRVDELERLAAAPAQRGEALRDLAQTLTQRGELAGARQSLERAIAMLRDERAGDAQAQRWAAETTLGTMDLYENRPDLARDRIEASASRLEQLAPGSLAHADALQALAILRHSQKRPDDSKRLLDESLSIKARHLGESPASMARARYEHAMLVWNLLDDAAGSEVHLRAAWSDMRRAVGEEHLNAAVIEQKVGRALLYRGRIEDAQHALTHAGHVFEAHEGQIDARKLVEMQIYGVEAFLANGRLGQAQAAMQATAARLRAIADDTTRWRLYADMVDAEMLTQTGGFDAALRVLEPWMTSVERTYGADHSSSQDLRLRLARVHFHARALERAQALLETVVRDTAAAPPGDPLRQAANWLWVSLLIEQRRFAEAAQVADELQLRVLGGADAPQGAGTAASATYLLARIEAGQGRHALALPLYREALGRYASLGYAHNPLLAEARSFMALSLFELGRAHDAREQVVAARAAFDREPLAGPQYRQALREAAARGWTDGDGVGAVVRQGM